MRIGTGSDGERTWIEIGEGGDLGRASARGRARVGVPGGAARAGGDDLAGEARDRRVEPAMDARGGRRGGGPRRRRRLLNGAATGARPSAGGSRAPRGIGAAARWRRREDAAARVGDSAVEHVGERASLGDDDAGARVAREWQPPRRRARFQTSRGPNCRTGGSRRKVSSLEYVTFVFVCVSVM